MSSSILVLIWSRVWPYSTFSQHPYDILNQIYNFKIKFLNEQKYYTPINNTFNIGRASYFDIKSIYGLSILKRCSEELKVAINYMDVDDVSVEVECDKVSGSTHCK